MKTIIRFMLSDFSLPSYRPKTLIEMCLQVYQLLFVPHP